MRLVSEYLGGYREISRAEISGLLKSYGGSIERETDNLLFFSTDDPAAITSRIAFSKRIGRIIEDSESMEVELKKRYAIREKRGTGRESLIDATAKRVKGKVDLNGPDIIYYIYNDDEQLITELIYERKMSELLDPRYKTKPMNHPSSITPILARGMINISGLKKREKFIDPFAGTGTYLIEGYRMGIEGYGIDRSWKMVEGGNSNLRHFNFPETIKQGDFSELVNVEGITAIVTDPPYGRGTKIFSQSRDSLYSSFFSLISGIRGNKVFCVPSIELLELAREYLDVKLAGTVRVHSSLTRYIVSLS
ncbi:MAG: hypothetical protein M0Z77_06535 [Thermoplasmatales archaeon]|nr:hypothetical protein [Candidatus Thermoplasmatota archaeon]MCL6002125.1 hypothetical protein [Candidatus Thermoplasmatota archaeon]MDA8055291.1 hypothetical protein [Thermoplasmatales archaeon]